MSKYKIRWKRSKDSLVESHDGLWEIRPYYPDDTYHTYIVIDKRTGTQRGYTHDATGQDLIWKQSEAKKFADTMV